MLTRIALAALTLLVACGPGQVPETSQTPTSLAAIHRGPGGFYSLRYPSGWYLESDADDGEGAESIILMSSAPLESPRPDSGYALLDGDLKIDANFQRGPSPESVDEFIRENCRGNEDLKEGPPVEVISCTKEPVDGELVGWVVLHNSDSGVRIVMIGGTVDDVAVGATAFLPDGPRQGEGESIVRTILGSIRVPAE